MSFMVSLEHLRLSGTEARPLCRSGNETLELVRQNFSGKSIVTTVGGLTHLSPVRLTSYLRIGLRGPLRVRALVRVR